MTTTVSIGDVTATNTGTGIHNPQHIRLITSGRISGVFQTAVMDIYTGTCVFTFQKDDLDHDDLISLVPLGLHGTGPNMEIQGYPPDAATAMISASMTSFGDEPTGAAVDGAVVKLETHNFPGFSAKVLVIRAEIGVEGGKLHRMAYQVTVLAQPGDGGIDSWDGMIRNVGPNQTVPTVL